MMLGWGFKTTSAGTGNGNPPSLRDIARGTLAEQLQQIEWLASTFFLSVFLAILVYSVAEWWRLAQCAQTALCNLGVLLFNLGMLGGLAVAGAVVGGLLGFLFGIPRTMQGNGAPAPVNSPGGVGSPADEAPKPTPIARSGRAFAGNSNLEEISDWLTKIIVGVGLVQASSIYAKLFELAAGFKAAIPNSQGADVMFLLVLVSALIGGFLFLYLETRTRVMQLFTDVEAVIAPDHALTDPAIRTALQTPIGTGRGQATAPSSSEDEQLLKVPYGALKTGDQLAAWGSAQARAGNLQAANQALRDAIAKEPGKKDYLVRLADVLEKQGSHEAAGALITEAQQKQGDDLSLLKRDLVQALYLEPPGSFETAIPITQQLLSRPDGATDPFVHVWTAAAEGQHYRWLSEHEGSDVEKQAARARALASAKKVVELSPEPKSPARTLLRGMLDTSQPGAPAEDNDLEVFKDDPEFKSVINAGI